MADAPSVTQAMQSEDRGDYNDSKYDEWSGNIPTNQLIIRFQ